MNDEFYVGYFGKAPRPIARLILRTSACMLISGAAIAVALVFGQSPFAASKFEYGVTRAYEGIVESRPYPMLVTSDARYLLVAPGKRGFSARDIDGKRTTLEASLIQRGSDSMLEVSRVISTTDQGKPPAEFDLGLVTLTGEIVDSKCYLGVMNPGNGKVHRDCAARCISGGIPPAFIVRDAVGETQTILLAAADGSALNARVLDYVAEPVEISGRLSRSGSTLVLRADLSQGIKRIARRIPE